MEPSDVDVKILGQLMSQYEYQLRTGCGNDECRQLLCHTGRANCSPIAIRRYTVRSAKAIALTMCSGPSPTDRLCRYCPLQDHNAKPHPPPAGRRDESSILQQLCDTPSLIRMHPLKTVVPLELLQFHRQIDQLMELSDQWPTSLPKPASANFDLVNGLLPIMDFLVSSLPPHRPAVLEMVDRDIISKGHCYPQKTETPPNDGSFNAWVELLDAFEYEPHSRLLRRIMLVIAGRLLLEHRSRELLKKTTGNSDQPAADQTISERLAHQLYERSCGKLSYLYALVVFMKKHFAKTWSPETPLQPGTVAHAILDIFAFLDVYRQALPDSFPRDAFKLPVIYSRTTPIDLATSWLDDMSNSHHLLEYPFVLSLDQLFLCFRTVNHMVMREAHSQSAMALALRQRELGGSETTHVRTQVTYTTDHYLLLNVSRTDVLKSTFDQLWQRRKGEFRRPLRVRLGEIEDLEMGQDLGGVQIEFFNVLCRELFSPDAQMFATDPINGVSYFQSGSLQPLHMFELFGVLLALAIYNGITIPIRLPRILYSMLCDHDQPMSYRKPNSVEYVRDGWPTIANSLEGVLINNIEGMEYAFALEANGVRLTSLPLADVPDRQHNTPREMRVLNATAIRQDSFASKPAEGSYSVDVTGFDWPGWTLVHSEDEPEAADASNPEPYVAAHVKWLTYSSVAPQIDAFIKGFRSSDLLDSRTLNILGPTNLKAFVEGSDHLNINELRAAVRYDGFNAASKYIQNFWRIVSAWPETKQKRLLKFVTAAERIPILGARYLAFIIKKAHSADPESLPTSSTCFGTLFLPKYATPEILSQKLSLALDFGTEGFGTG